MKAHITNLGLENFRVFKDKTDFEFAPITILTGTNSSGKSSLINAIRLLRDNYQSVEISKNGKVEITQLFAAEFDAKELIEKYGSIAHFPNWSDSTGFSFFTNVNFANEHYNLEFKFKIHGDVSKKAKLVGITAIQGESDMVIFEINETTIENPAIDVINAEGPTLKDVFNLHLEPKLQAYDIFLNPIYLLSGFSNFLKINADFYATHSMRKEADYYNKLSKTKKTLFDWSNLEKVLEKSKNGQRIKANSGNTEFYEYLENTVFKFLSKVNWRHPYCEKGVFLSTKSDIYGLLKHFSLGSKGIFSLSFFMRKYLENCYDLEISDIDGMITDVIPTEIDINQYISKYLQNKYNLDFTLNELQDLASLMALIIENSNKPSDDTFEENTLDLNSKEIPSLYSVFHDEFFGSYVGPLVNSFLLAFRNYSILDIVYVSSNRSNEKRVKNMLDKDEMSKEIGRLIGAPNNHYQNALTFINKYLNLLGISQKLTLEPDADSANYKIFLSQPDGRKTLINDFGQGISKLLPIIMGVFQGDEQMDFELESAGIDGGKVPTPRTILVEEPEINLHPALQSKLADLFVDAARTFNTQFIIETHSEYLIRKLQYLTAKGEIKPEDTAIYYFYPPDHPNVVSGKEPQVKKIDILSDGRLSSPFGEGFFDESSRLMIDLMNINPN